MTYTFEETPESRAQQYGTSSTDDSVTLQYKSVGEQNDATVRLYAEANAPGTVNGLNGTLYRKTIALRPDGFAQYYVDVMYGPLDIKALPSGSYTFNFDTTGGSVNIKCAKAHVASYGTSPPSHNGAIGVRGDGTVDGAEIVIPKLRFNLAFRFPSGTITIAYMKAIASITGTTNSKRFLGFDAGELLFLGATGSNGSVSEMEVSFAFEASTNATGITTGGISGVTKKGHDYLWHEFGDEVDTGKPVTRAKYVHVEQVYDSADFDAYFGWNIFTG